MVSTFEPIARQRRDRRSVASGVSATGVSRHQRLSKSSGKPLVGPECSVPARGWAGTKRTVSGRCGATASITAAFTEPTSLTVAPGFRCGPISAATSPIAPTGTQSTTRSAPATASAAVSTTRSQSPSSAATARVSAERAVPTISPARPSRRIRRPIDPAISPSPISATRS